MPTISRIAIRDAVTLQFVMAMLFGSASLCAPIAQGAPGALEPPAVCVSAQPAATSAASALAKKDAATRFAGDAFVRTELYFGSERPDLPEVSPRSSKNSSTSPSRRALPTGSRC
jgi:hypothetical protein